MGDLPSFAVTTMWVNFVSGYWVTESAADAFVDNVNTPTVGPPPPVALVRTARAASGTTFDVDVTGGRTLFMVRNVSSASNITCDNIGVTLLAQDISRAGHGLGDRRGDQWHRPLHRSQLRCMGLLPDRPTSKGRDGRLQRLNTTADMGNTMLAASVSAPVVVYWATDANADWGVAAGYTALDIVLTASFIPTWDLSYRQAPVPYGPFVTPAMDRGRSGSTMYENIAAITLAGYVLLDAGKPKVWSGTAWVKKPAKVWNGSAWVAEPVKLWTPGTGSFSECPRSHWC